MYSITELLGKAYPKAFNPENIISGIRASGVYPTNRDVFKDYQFFLSYVSDRMPTTSSKALTREVSMLSASPVQHLDSFNINPETEAAQVLSLNEKQRSTDDSLKRSSMQTPFQKAQQEKNMKKSEVLTDTPMKQCITARIKAVSAKKPKSWNKRKSDK